MNEAQLAAAIRDRLAPSPSRFGNSTYFALRISGTGIADRPALEEICYRCPEIWTSEAMLSRCAGLPIIAGHPRTGNLDSSEYAARSIGAVVLPYAEAGECWGVGRICDDEAASAMASGKLSTSPMVTLAPEVAVTLEGANKLVIEGDPQTLDHLAIVPAGIWDKGAPPSGIRIDTATKEITVMADEKDGKEIDGKKPDATGEGQEDALAKIMSALGGVGDAITSLGRRLDTLEKTNETRADAEAIRCNDGGRRDAAAKEEAALASEQARADEVEQKWGRSAPRYLPNETPRQYLVRSLHPHKEHSPHWKNFDLSQLPMAALQVAAEQIRADSIAASRTPTAPAGRLLKRRSQLPTGHFQDEYFGDVHTADAPFRIQPRFATFMPQNRA